MTYTQYFSWFIRNLVIRRAELTFDFWFDEYICKFCTKLLRCVTSQIIDFGVIVMRPRHRIFSVVSGNFQGISNVNTRVVYLFIYLFTYRQWINPYLATYDYLKSIIEN